MADKPIEVNPPPIANVQGMADGSDPRVTFNMRGWLRKACEAQGARFTGGSIGCEVADIDIELEGFSYNITIKPITR